MDAIKYIAALKILTFLSNGLACNLMHRPFLSPTNKSCASSLETPDILLTPLELLDVALRALIMIN